MKTAYLKTKHEAGLSWDAYLATDPEKAANWTKFHDQVTLTDEQRRLVEGFSRTMRVLCVSGIWCGDCVQQGPLLQRIAEVNGCIDLRWVDRDEHADLAEQVKINAGLRVPLTRYRAMAANQLAAACPLPGAPVPPDQVQDTLQDWLDEFERVQLLLRLSGRLRQMHGD